MSKLKILALDISKVSTGIAFYDGEFDALQTITFVNSAQWEKEVTTIIDLWKPNCITFSETVNRLCSHSTKRILYGLMYHLEHIAYKRDIMVMPINDTPAKHFIGIKMKKRDQIKADTIAWAENMGLSISCDDESDAACFSYYVYHKLQKEKE